jgi:hypothetical protein
MNKADFKKYPFDINSYINIHDNREYKEGIFLSDNVIYLTCPNGYFAPCYLLNDLIKEIGEMNIPSNNNPYSLFIRKDYKDMDMYIVNKLSLKILYKLKNKATFWDVHPYNSSFLFFIINIF